MLNWVQIWPEGTPPAPADDYLCFTAVEPNSEIRLFKSLNPASVTLEISTDWTNWNTYTLWNTITLHNIWDKVYRRNSSETDTLFSTSAYDYYRFSMTWAISWSGNVTYLLNKNWTDTLSAYCFRNLFRGCAALITAPNLPITTTAAWCCWAMFYSCSSLTTLPILPATTLEAGCYREMFFSCTNIKLSETRVWEYQTEYRIPASWTWIDQRNALVWMFGRTWWTFWWNPNINQTYYTSNSLVPLPEWAIHIVWDFAEAWARGTLPSWWSSTSGTISYSNEGVSLDTSWWTDSVNVLIDTSSILPSLQNVKKITLDYSFYWDNFWTLTQTRYLSWRLWDDGISTWVKRAGIYSPLQHFLYTGSVENEEKVETIEWWHRISLNIYFLKSFPPLTIFSSISLVNSL